MNGYLDLLTLWFLSTFGKKPMHVFGFLGTIVFFIGFLSAFLIGNEAEGLSNELAGKADRRIRIPMRGHVESLNASLAAAVLLYEADRQRRAR